jgi:hypothetical protein
MTAKSRTKKVPHGDAGALPISGDPQGNDDRSPSRFPPFYRDPVPLAAARHGQWRLRQGNAAFAAEASAIPLVLSDFPLASRHYPILFTTGQPAAVALVGFEHANLFVTDGQWAAGAHVPAYVRRYPFIFAAAPDNGGFGLAIDAGSELIAKDGHDGDALFDGDRPAATTLRALEFCRLFNADHDNTKAFCLALADRGLLIERNAEVRQQGGRKRSLSGFRIVDASAFGNLDDETVLAWHRNGWLAMIHHHLASLVCFGELLSRQSARDATQMQRQ